MLSVDSVVGSYIVMSLTTVHLNVVFCPCLQRPWQNYEITHKKKTPEASKQEWRGIAMELTAPMEVHNLGVEQPEESPVDKVER